jgi:hypothetical protein
MNKLTTMILGASMLIGSAFAADQKPAPAAAKSDTAATEKKTVKKHSRKHTKKAPATANAAAPAAKPATK